MTARKKTQSGISLLLIFAMLLSFAGIFHQDFRGGFSSGTLLSTKVKIKTQSAANKLFKNGAIRGIDVSKYQGDINWKKVAADDVEFVFVRASYGTTKDPYFIKNCQGANKYGLKVGAYHFATFTTKAQMRKEAQYFISRLKKVEITYPVVLDLEGNSHKKLKKSTLTNLAVQFMQLVEAEGYTVMLYSGNNFIRDHLSTSKLKDYDLWVANYLERPKTIEHAIWQHTASGKVSGISGNVDINVAYQDMSVRRRRPTAAASTNISASGGSSSRDDDDDGSTSSSSSSSGSKESNKNIASKIRTTINDRYMTNLKSNSSRLAIGSAIAKGLQYEIVHQYGEELSLTGQLTRDQVDILAAGGFKKKTKSNITYLVQAKLYFEGYYKQVPTSMYDNDTAAAMKAFQKAKGLEADGRPDAETLKKLLL